MGREPHQTETSTPLPPYKFEGFPMPVVLDSSLARVSSNKEFVAWRDMTRRCYDALSENYARYGGRGIVVCDRWRYSFAAFLGDMGKAPSKAHSLDRIDNDGAYEPSNCRWATFREQMANKRNTIWIEYQDERITLAELCRRTGIKHKVLDKRLRRGFTVQQAVETPIRKRMRNST